MEFVDCGLSGLTGERPHVSWESLGLPEPWTSILRLLSGMNGPRPVQVEAFSNTRILENRRNVVVSAPTNAGKSLVGVSVLLDAVRRGGRAVLLEPLRALAREKADELESRREALGQLLGIDLQVRLTTGDYRLADEDFSAPPPDAGQLARHEATGVTDADLKTFFLRSLGGEAIASRVGDGLRWLTDPARVIAYRGESGAHRLTTLGLRAVRSTLPLEIAAGVGQLVRDLLQADPEDRWLSRWTPLDHLLILECLSSRPPPLRRFNRSLPDQLDAWMEGHSGDTPALYREWIRGAEGQSRADHLLGSLGLVLEPEPARRTAMMATLRAVVLRERSQGVSVAELERRWSLSNLAGVEEHWRDRQLWLIAALRPLLDTRCFYFCLREHCRADDARIDRITRILHAMRLSLFGLQEHLKYCSPLGGILLSIRRSLGARIGPATVRRLEGAGVTNFSVLASMSQEELIQIGVRRDTAQFICTYVKRRSQ